MECLSTNIELWLKSLNDDLEVILQSLVNIWSLGLLVIWKKSSYNVLWLSSVWRTSKKVGLSREHACIVVCMGLCKLSNRRH